MNLNQTTLLMVLVIVMILYYSSNALSSAEGSVKKYVYKRKQLGSVVGDHGGLLVSSPEINIRTRGPEMNYQQQGILYRDAEDGGGVLGLYGRQKYPGSSQWEYLVRDKSLEDIKIPLDQKKELDDNEEVSVKGLGSGYKVQLYDNEELKYLPW